MKNTANLPRPSSVKNALRVLVLCLSIELLGFTFSGEYSAGRLLGVVAGVVLLFWMMRQVHARRNWARYALTGFIGVSIVVSVVSFGSEYRQHPGENVIGVLSILLSLISAVLLFTPVSNDWFSPVRRP